MPDWLRPRQHTNKMAFIPDREHAGVEVMPLFHDNHEEVRLERWAPGAAVALDGARWDGSPRPSGIVFRKGRDFRAAIVVASAKGRRRLGHGRGHGCTGLDQTRPPGRDATAAGMMCTVAPDAPNLRPHLPRFPT